MHTPWGKADHSKSYGPGITFYGTPSHGGFHVSAELNKQIPDYFRTADGYADGNAGWYEEDCAWSLVVTIFPDRFDEEMRKSAKWTVANTYPEVYERFYGVVLAPGESHAKDEAKFAADHAKDYLVLSAYGDWHAKVPKGYVGVFAGIGGRTPNGMFPDTVKWFLVPEEKYQPKMVLSRGAFCFYTEIEAIS